MVLYKHINRQVAEDIASVKPEYLDATFTAIRKQYGSVDNFLRGPIGLDDNKIMILKRSFLNNQSGFVR